MKVVEESGARLCYLTIGYNNSKYVTGFAKRVHILHFRHAIVNDAYFNYTEHNINAAAHMLS